MAKWERLCPLLAETCVDGTVVQAMGEKKHVCAAWNEGRCVQFDMPERGARVTLPDGSVLSMSSRGLSYETIKAGSTD